MRGKEAQESAGTAGMMSLSGGARQRRAEGHVVGRGRGRGDGRSACQGDESRRICKEVLGRVEQDVAREEEGGVGDGDLWPCPSRQRHGKLTSM